VFCSTLVLVATLFVLAGCASHKAELPPQVSDDLVVLRDRMVQGKAQLQTTYNAARDLIQRPQAQLDPQVNRLLDSIDSLERLATNNRTQFASAEERVNAYFEHWEQELQGMSEALAEQGEKRRVESRKSFEQLQNRVAALRQEFQPSMASLREVSKYLKTDTTAAGVKVVTPQITTVLAGEDSLMAKADAIISQIDAMRGGK
jgi:DNA repair exonuclease SbcCD ATPase subunit